MKLSDYTLFMWINRIQQAEIESSLQINPVTAILGPRQCGKSSLAKEVLKTIPNSIYLDLERPSDLAKLTDPELFLKSQEDKTVCIDEVQFRSDLFPILRSLVDENRRPGRFLLLGSASRELVQQSSESLAGRISYKRLTPFLWDEIHNESSVENYLFRGGFPNSFFAESDFQSNEWRQDFIGTFLEKDLRFFSGFSAVTMRKLWQMLAYSNGQTLNLSRFGESLGLSHTSVRNYIDLLEATFMVKQVQPWSGNTKKRLIKTPKVYITDTGLVNALLFIQSLELMFGHPVFGSLWEGLIVQHISTWFPRLDMQFFRTNHGTEIDIVLTQDDKTLAVECKASVKPEVTAGFWNAKDEINASKGLIVAPVEMSYPYRKDVDVVTLLDLKTSIQNFFFTS